MTALPASRTPRISRAEGRRLVRRELLNDDSADLLAVDCAVLRSVLWALSEAGAVAVNVNKFLNVAASVDLTDGVSVEHAAADGEATASPEEARRARLRASLDQLEEGFDLVGLPNGYWLPAPTRVVPVTPARLMLVGGCPTNALPEEFQETVEHRGPFRRLKTAAVRDALDLPTEELDSWLGSAPADLKGWGTEVITQAALEAYSSNGEVEEFNAYVPGLARSGCPQGFRWMEVGTKLPNGRYLARRRRVVGLQESRIIEVRVGNVVASGVPSVERRDLRRLQYALDALAGNPTKARVHEAAGEVSFELKSELPRREQRILATLGTVTSPAEKYYPRTWTLARADVPRAREVLLELGVTLER